MLALHCGSLYLCPEGGTTNYDYSGDSHNQRLPELSLMILFYTDQDSLKYTSYFVAHQR